MARLSGKLLRSRWKGLALLCALSMIASMTAGYLIGRAAPALPAITHAQYMLASNRIEGRTAHTEGGGLSVIVFTKVADAWVLQAEDGRGVEISGDGSFAAPVRIISMLTPPSEFRCFLVPEDFVAEGASSTLNAVRRASLSEASGSMAMPGHSTTTGPVATFGHSTTSGPVTTTDPTTDPTTEPATKPAGPSLADVAYTPDGYVTGRVIAENPSAYRLILFITVNSMQVVKPDFMSGRGYELSGIQADGSFTIRAWHPDARAGDLTADSYSLFLVPESFEGIRHMNDMQSAQTASIAHYNGIVPR